MEAFSYLDKPRSGLMNMAIDDAMLDFASEHQAVVLRLYQWAEPTLSLGYFQKIEERELHEPSRSIAMVRRATGGGAIVHDHDLTYSLVVPQLSSHVGAAPAIYAAVHGAMVGWLNELGLLAKQWQPLYGLCKLGVQPEMSGNPEFLCFRRRSGGDVVANEHKVMGSAQRRGKAALLQHGSLLLRRSEHAPELPGLGELLGEELKLLANRRLFAGEMLLRLEGGIDALLGVRLKCDYSLMDALEDLGSVKVAKFAGAEWRCRA